MKCIKHLSNSEIIRIKDEVALERVASGDWIFIPKSEWKEKVRDSNQ